MSVFRCIRLAPSLRLSRQAYLQLDKICMLRVVLVCKLNDNTVNKIFKYQKHDVSSVDSLSSLITSLRSKRRVFNIFATLVLKSFIYSIIVYLHTIAHSP